MTSVGWILCIVNVYWCAERTLRVCYLRGKFLMHRSSMLLVGWILYVPFGRCYLLGAFYASLMLLVRVGEALSILILSGAISSADFRRPQFCMLGFSATYPAAPQFKTTGFYHLTHKNYYRFLIQAKLLFNRFKGGSILPSHFDNPRFFAFTK
jgi:hypothetical protein